MSRRYYACRHCGRSRALLDDWAGLGKGHLSNGAKRMVCLAATGWSFDQASAHLRELSGLEVSDQTVRRVAEAEGGAAHTWLETSARAVEKVRCGAGNAEWLSDGTMVNTRQGWQEVRLTVCSTRPAGAPRDPAAFTGLDDRNLPKPTARLVLVHQRCSHEMGELWRRTSRRLGWGRGQGVSVIADGAKWIAAEAERVLPQAERVVDVYHVSQHLHECGAALHGEPTEAARAWATERLGALVREGPAVLLWRLEREAESEPDAPKRAALRRLLGYLGPNREALRYGDRLRRGLAIGSGQVEGACKTVVGRRLKLNSARWSPQNTETIAALCCLNYSDLRDAYWSSRAA